jgi:hypothetical protein
MLFEEKELRLIVGYPPTKFLVKAIELVNECLLILIPHDMDGATYLHKWLNFIERTSGTADDENPDKFEFKKSSITPESAIEINGDLTNALCLLEAHLLISTNTKFTVTKEVRRLSSSSSHKKDSDERTDPTDTSPLLTKISH